MKELQLGMKSTSHCGVILGSSAAVKGKGVCEYVEIKLNGWKVVANFLPLELVRGRCSVGDAMVVLSWDDWS